MSNMDAFKSAGAEVIAVVATNDAFTMQQWGKATGGADSGVRIGL